MNRIRQVLALVRQRENAPVLVASREAEAEQARWQELTRRILEDSKRGSPGPLLNYIRGAGARRERPS